MESARRNVHVVRSHRHSTGSQLQRVLGHLRLAFDGHELAWVSAIAAADRPGTSASLLALPRKIFALDRMPPVWPSADSSPTPSASRSAISATWSHARAFGQPEPPCPPLCAFAAAADRTCLLPEPAFRGTSDSFPQLEVATQLLHEPTWRPTWAMLAAAAERAGGLV